MRQSPMSRMELSHLQIKYIGRVRGDRQYIYKIDHSNNYSKMNVLDNLYKTIDQLLLRVVLSDLNERKTSPLH